MNETRAPDDEPIEVLLLGTHHFNGGGGFYPLEPDDVLTPGRQAELRGLADRLAGWEPNRIALEWPAAAQSALDAEYDRYREAGDTESVDESEEHVQIGFRLADRLGHDSLLAADEHVFFESYPDAYDEPFRDWWEGRLNLADEVPLPVPDAEQLADRDEQLLAASTLPEFLAYLNGRERREHSGERIRYGLLGWDDEDGVRHLAAWQERNLRIVRNLLDGLEGGRRVLLLIGAGHVPDLQHVLDQTPGVEPVDPAPLLPDPPKAPERT